MTAQFQDVLRRFTFSGVPTVELEAAGLRYFVNEYWTAGNGAATACTNLATGPALRLSCPGF